jgi:hypothetical protein
MTETKPMTNDERIENYVKLSSSLINRNTTMLCVKKLIQDIDDNLVVGLEMFKASSGDVEIEIKIRLSAKR